MGNTTSIRKINCEDMQKACKNTNNYIIINTLEPTMQNCLIANTTKIENEEALMNSIIKKSNRSPIIVNKCK